MLAEPFDRRIAVIMLLSRKVAPCEASISLTELALDQGLAQSPRKVVGFCRSGEKETDGTTAGGESWTKKRKPGNVTPRDRDTSFCICPHSTVRGQTASCRWRKRSGKVEEAVRIRTTSVRAP
jgi:hypothetical protein